MAWRDLDIGAVSAYAIAVEHGYTGTEEEWASEQAAAGENARIAKKSAESAKSSEQNAIKTLEAIKEASTDLIEDIETAGATQISNVQSEGATQIRSVKDAGNEQSRALSAQGDVEQRKVIAAGDEQVSRVTNAGNGAVESVTLEKTNAVNSVQSTKVEAVNSVESAKTSAVEAVKSAESAAIQNIGTGVDDTLSISGKAADAKKTGDSISSLKGDIDTFITSNYQFINEQEFIIDKYWLRGIEKQVDGSNCALYPPIKVKKGKKYSVNYSYGYFTFVIYDNGDIVYASDEVYTAPVSFKFKAKENGKLYVTIPTNNTSVSDVMVVDSDVFPPKVQNGYYNVVLQGRSSRNSNIITVAIDGTGDYSSFTKAVTSIKDSSYDNPYTIIIKEGEYDIISELGGESFVQNASGEYGVTLSDYVNLLGVGNVTLKGYINPNWAYNYDAVSKLSTLNLKGNNDLENVNITAENMRYAVHDESGWKEKNWKRRLKNCKFRHFGNSGVNDGQETTWVSTSAYGLGASSGCEFYAENCEFVASEFYGFLAHDNKDFEKGALLKFDNCIIKNLGESSATKKDLELRSYLSGTEMNQCILNNCIIKSVKIRCEIGSEVDKWQIRGGGNKADYIRNIGTLPEDIYFE